MMSLYKKNAGSESVSITWRAIYSRPYTAVGVALARAVGLRVKLVARALLVVGFRVRVGQVRAAA